jgi:hypothetical protein
MVTMPSWTYTNKIITAIEDMPEDTYGFIYETTHKPTGKKYIGKKVLYFERNKKLGKKALQALKEERKAKGIGGRVPLKQKVITESDWKDYYGSHKDILDLLKKGEPTDFVRKILCFVPNKKLLTYYECKYLFINEVLEQEDRYINDNILGKFYRKDFNETK